MIISIGGESGSGKTYTSNLIAKKLRSFGRRVRIFRQDKYFYGKPRVRNKRRRDGSTKIGVNEVNLKQLQKDIDNCNTDIIIVEGTYTTLLNVDFRIFMSMDYKQTKFRRDRRHRDPKDAAQEQILALEHEILVTHRELADLIITNYNRKFQCLE